MAALGDPDVDGEEIARIVATDQALSLTVMKTANSALHGGGEEAGSLGEALTRLGLDSIRRLVLAQQSAVLFSRAPDGFGQQPVDAWQGALAGAIAAENFTRRTGSCDPSVAFTAGLLRDCGKLAMDELVGAANISRVLEDDQDKPVPELERETFGFDHAEVGAALA